MSSFDIVCKTDVYIVDNAIASTLREVTARYDFKGSHIELTRADEELTLLADDQYKLDQVQAMLKAHMVKQKIDAKALEFGKVAPASGNALRQSITIRNGISSEIAKEIVKDIKQMKLKVQASIRGDEVRVEGKKRDELQHIISHFKAKEFHFPLQFINFRD